MDALINQLSIEHLSLLLVMGFDDMIYMMIASAIMSVVSMLLQKQPSTPHLLPSALENIPVAERGKEIPVVLGKRFVRQPNVVWYGDIAAEPRTIHTGGMSGSSKS